MWSAILQFSPLTYPVELSKDELSLLLATVGSVTFPGGDQAALSPIDGAAREAQWAAGRYSLEARALLVPGSEPGTHNMHPALPMLAVTLANPALLLLTQIDTSGAPPGGVSHYLRDDMIVELTQRDAHYLLTALASVDVLAARIVAQLPSVPETSSGRPFTLTTADFGRVRAGQRLSNVPDALVAALTAAPASAVLAATRFATERPVVNELRIILTSRAAAWWIIQTGEQLQFLPQTKHAITQSLSAWLTALRTPVEATPV